MRERRLQFDRRAVLSGLGAGAAALAGCSTISGDSGVSHLRVGTILPPTTLDPIVATDLGSRQTVARVFDGLYTYGSGTDVVPQIAAGPPRIEDDGRRVTVTLDDEARFQDGEAVTPADVRYSYLAPQREGAASQWAVEPVESVEAVDDRTVRFHLEHPYPAVEHALARPIVPEAVREADREGFAHDPVGAGPFRVESFGAGKKATLARWDDYWGEPAPAIDRLSFAYVESPITQLMGLVTGQSDAIEPISPRYRHDVESLTGGEVAERPGFRSFYVGFNCNEGPTTDPAVREAVARSIDLEAAVSRFVEPVGTPQYSLLPRRVAEAWDLPVDEWAAAAAPYDVEGARARFEEADVDVGQLTILTSKHPIWKELAHELASGLRDAGQSAIVDALPWKKYQKRYVSGVPSDYALFVGAVSGTGDPDSFLYPIFHENAEGATNGIFYDDDAAMQPLQAARETTDRARRRELYATAVTRLLEARVHLPVCSFQNSFAHVSAIDGLRVHPIPDLNPRVTSPDGVVRMEGR